MPYSTACGSVRSENASARATSAHPEATIPAARACSTLAVRTGWTMRSGIAIGAGVGPVTGSCSSVPYTSPVVETAVICHQS